MMKVFQDLDVDGSVEGTSFIKTGGTSSQFLKADGSIDSTTYAGAYVHPSYATTNINTSGSTIVDSITTNSTGHITAMGTRVLTLANLGFTGATNANYITNNNQLTNGAGYVTTDTDTVYTHPTYTGADTSVASGALTGAAIFSELNVNVTTDTLGHVTNTFANVSTRTLTLADLGYTGDTGANSYTHPSHPGDDISIDSGALTGAVVISDIDLNVTTDTLGHVTDANATLATRTLTLANLGFTGATNANFIQNNNQLSNGAGYAVGTISTSESNNTIVKRTTAGYIHTSYFNGSGTFATSGASSGMGVFTGANGSDTYGRSYTAGAARTLLNVADGATNVTNNNQIANGAGYITSAGNTNTQRSDEEIRDVAAAQWIDGTNTTVVVDDAANTIKINATGGSSGIDGSGTAKFIPRFSDSDTLTDSSIYEDNDGNILINSSTIGDGALNVYQTTTDPSLHIVTNDAGASAGPIIKMERDSSTPADDDLLGQIQFVGKDSSANNITYGGIQGYIYDKDVGAQLRGGVKLQSFQSATTYTSLETVGSRGYLNNSWYVNDEIVITGTADLGIETGATIELNGSSGQIGKVLTSQGSSTPTWEPVVGSDVSEGGTGSVVIGNMVKITAAAHSALGAGADADTLYIIVG